MKLNEKPYMTMQTIKDMEDMSFFTYAQIFDDLLIVAQKETNCFVWKTSEGLVIIDAIWPDERVYQAICQAITETDWNTKDIYKLVLTHGHVDHTGCGKWIAENHKVDIYMSKIDDIFWQEHPTKPDRPNTWKDYDISVYIKDGDTISCGDKRISVYETPGHTPGSLSYIFPVHENGEEHMAAVFGGATPPWNSTDGAKEYLRSVVYFKECTKKQHADVMLCNHTAFDNGQERIAYSKKRLSYLPNIYVIGEDGVQKFFDVFETLGKEKLEQK